MGLDLYAIRQQFPALARLKDGRPVIFLDNPAGTQVPGLVARRMSDMMLYHNANLGGQFDTSIEASELAAQALRAAAMFLNAADENEVFFGQSMTALTFSMARSICHLFNAGDEIILTRMDHDANVSPWLIMADEFGLKVSWLDFEPDSFEFDLGRLRELITPRTRLIATCQASNVTGTINDIAQISRIARESNILVYVDAVQFAAHGNIDVQALGCDFLVCSAYKFYGPHCAIFWGRRALLERIKAYKVRPSPETLPWRFSIGTPNVEGMVGTHAAIDYICSVGALGPRIASVSSHRAHLVAGFEAMRAHDDMLALRLIQGLQAIDGVRILGIVDPAALNRRVATISFVMRGLAPASIAQAMAARGIQLWSGHNYAIEFYRYLGLLENGGAVRIGAVHYNTVEEIDRTIAALREVAANARNVD